MKQGRPQPLLIIQDHLFSGGAARAANRWSKVLETEGLSLQRVVGDQATMNNPALSGKPPRGWARLVEWVLGRQDSRRKKVDQGLNSILQEVKPDLIWFHNIAGGGKWGWSENMITTARQHAPVIWTLHDMWALGESSESYWQEDKLVEGEKWKGAKVEKLRGLGVEGLRRSRVEKVSREPGKYPVRLTAPSKWLVGMTKKIGGCKCAFLPNPIDLRIFSPGDRMAARRRWGLPEEGLVVLAGADSLADPRKGFDLLRQAWEPGRMHGATLALFGRHGENRPGEKYLGNLTSDDEMMAAYQAADLYVHPARMENAPCTIQESLACGTPVLAFAVGGIPEMVEPGRTGFLADKVSAESLQEVLTLVLSNPSLLVGMREKCRKTAEVVWRPEALLEEFKKVVQVVSVVGGR